MKKYFNFILIAFFLSGCGSATYTRVNQLTPQKTLGWDKSSSQTFCYECNQGEVRVGPIILGYEGAGDVSLVMPIPESKEKIRKRNEVNAWVYVEFRDVNPVDTCDLAYVSLVEQGSGNQVTPVDSMDIPSTGIYKGKYTHACHYYFDLDKESKANYLFHVSEDVFGCKVNPIPFKFKKSLEFETREWM